MNDRIDPRLTRRLETSQDHELVQAVLVLHPDTHDTEAAARIMLERASAASGVAPVSVRILPRLGVMHVCGPTSFMKQLLNDEQVRAATIGPD